jgi:hypothetical protein
MADFKQLLSEIITYLSTWIKRFKPYNYAYRISNYFPLKDIMKSLYWVFLVSFFSLLQLLFFVSCSLILSDCKFEFIRVLTDGLLIFFATALVSSITIDYHFSEDVQNSLNGKHKWLASLLFTFFPMFILSISLVSFGVIFQIGIDLERVDKYWLTISQFVIIASAVFYAIISKTIFFSLSNKLSNKS